jgi:hypothetical protein
MSTLDTIEKLLDDPADLFCQLYDVLDEAEIRRGSTGGWATDRTLKALTLRVEEGALRGRLSDGTVRGFVADAAAETDAGDQALIWAVLRGLDSALEDGVISLSPPVSWSRPPAPGLEGARLRYEQYGRLDTGAAGGALLPKRTHLGHDPSDEELEAREKVGYVAAVRPADVFSTVFRVSSEAWDPAAFDVFDEDPPLATRDGEVGIVVGCVPLLSERDELEWSESDSSGTPGFAIDVLDTQALRDRIERVLARFDELGVMLGFCPELCLSGPLLKHWIDVVTNRPAPDDSRLEWIFLGSGSLESDGRHRNTGVLLDRRTGEVLLHQDKLFPFVLTEKQIAEWKLDDIYGRELREDIEVGERLAIRETSWGRIAILICEDLGKALEDDLTSTIRDYGVSLILAPVFSKPVLQWHWEDQAVRLWGTNVGSRSIVANSLVVPRMAQQTGEIGTSLVHAPGTGSALGRSADPEQVSLFWLTATKVERPATVPVFSEIGD